MKRIRLLVVQPTDEQFRDATANLSEDDIKKNSAKIKENMTIKYKAMLQSAMRTPLDSRSGVAIEEMEKSLDILKIIDAVEEDDGVLELEDADHEYLLTKLSVVRWAGFDQRIVTFVRTVKNATKDILDGLQNGST